MGKKLDWHFKTINPESYSIDITSDINNRLMKGLFLKSKKKIQKKTLTDTSKASLEGVETFIVEPKYFKMIKNLILRVPINRINKEIEVDGYSIVSSYIDKATFTRKNGKEWLLELVVTGEYIKK